MTVLEAIRKGADFLQRRGIESPRLQVELLLAHLLGLKRMELYLNFDRSLTPAQVDALRQLILRRSRHEPLQYIIGTVNFCGLELKVEPAVLIPRPETELLAEMGREYLQSLVLPDACARDAGSETRTGSGNPLAIDFGTGSGCLAIVLAVACPRAQVIAIDVSEAALNVARENALRHNVADRVRFVCADSLTALSGQAKADLVITNPPYIPTDQIPALQPEISQYEPRVALDGGSDGLTVFAKLAHEARGVLRDGGLFMAEFGDGQEATLYQMFTRAGWHAVEVKPDESGRARFLLARHRESRGSIPGPTVQNPVNADVPPVATD